MGMMPFYLPQFKKKFVGNVKSLWSVRKRTVILRNKRGVGGESTKKMISHSRELMDIHKGFANNTG